ncbi:MAG: glycosyltransferase family 4 protein [Steroidobacteraceae bacterium]
MDNNKPSRIAARGRRIDARSFAFIKVGEFSHTNHCVLKQLRARFPDLQADVIDVGDLRVIRKARWPQFAFAVASEFGLAACSTSERFRRHILKTSYFFLRAREALLQRLEGSRHAFTFQTQSLFDASSPGTPHFIYTDHTHLENLRYPAATAVSRVWTNLEASAYQNASMVFTMSSNISRSLIEQYGCSPQRVECVYAGSNVSAAAAENLEASRFGAKNILFVGIDWERKGGPVLLEAFRSIRRSHPQARLTIVGCSPEIHEPGVHVEGRVPLGEVAKYYRAASIFCLPTLNEPFGLVFLEAFSYGLPIVATRIGAIAEIVSEGRSGYLVMPQNAAELADRLGSLLDDPAQCAQFGSHGRQWVGERYSWEKTGDRLASHIQRVAKLAIRNKSEPVRAFSPVLAHQAAI